ncbi:helix-turn-helix domain-containing protein [Pendulispora albinea]|uniref:AraC family transcriptional regulator n=1 Tax=Pendulispora albinea TaxID=2741071 RepID=A0ABZ2M4L6_9BACT
MEVAAASAAAPRVSVRCYPPESDSHQHDWHQIVVPLEGALGLELGHRSHRVDRARGAWIPPGQAHAFIGIGDNRFLVLDVAEEGMGELGGIPGMGRGLGALEGSLSFRVEAGVDHLARGLLHLVEQRPEDARLHRHGAGLILLALAELGAGGADHAPERLQRAVDFIHRHFARPLRVADIASAASLGVSQLHALFRTFYGVTPMDYVAERRLDRAERLLEAARLPIAEIALRCGYSDQASLTRAMRARRGVTPGSVRRGRAMANGANGRASQSGTKRP